MKILLTGATGLLGSHLVDQGIQKGYKFILPYRKINKRSPLNAILDHKNVSFIPFAFDEDLSKLSLNEVDVVINSAAFLSPFEKDKEMMEFINTSFPQRLFSECEKHNISFFCQISSNSTFGSTDKSKVITENDTEDPRRTNYTKSKMEFDSWLQCKKSIAHSTIHPGFMLDKFDSKPSSGGVLLALKMKKFKFYTDGIKNIVAARDVAKGIYQNIEGKKQGSYLLGGENIEVEEFLKLACIKIGKNFSDLTKVSMDEIKEHAIEREFCLTQPFSSEKAKKVFNYQPELNADRSLIESFYWFKTHRILR